MIATIPGITLGKYLVANNQDTAGRCFEWLRDSVLGADDGLFDGAAPAYAALTELAATSPPGAGNVVFTPWLNGERSPIADEDARAGFHNLSLATTRADLVRAVLEGVAYNSRWLLDSVEKFAKRRLDPIRIIGGGAVSDLWCQIIADVTDHTIERVVEPLHAGIRGAAVFAGVALGDVRLDEVRNIVAVDTTFRPDPENRAVYGRLASELPKLHKAQKAMFGRLNGR
jgi:xylulokinase